MSFKITTIDEGSNQGTWVEDEKSILSVIHKSNSAHPYVGVHLKSNGKVVDSIPYAMFVQRDEASLTNQLMLQIPTADQSARVYRISDILQVVNVIESLRK